MTATTTPGLVLGGTCLLAAFVGGIALAIRSGRLRALLPRTLGGMALVGTAAAWGHRAWLAGHLPLFGTYESSLSIAFATLLATSALDLRRPRHPETWPFSCAVAGLVLTHGARFDPAVYALTISERSWVVDVHAVLAWLAFGGLAASAALGALRLVRRDDRVDGALSRALSWGFVLHSGMMASGAFYKFLLFGSAWTFDPIETLGFVAWVAYGTLLHLHLMAGWSGRRLAAWSLALFAILVVSYRGIVYFPAWSTYHVFDMDLRIHLTGSETIEIPEE